MGSFLIGHMEVRHSLLYYGLLATLHNLSTYPCQLTCGQIQAAQESILSSAAATRSVESWHTKSLKMVIKPSANFYWCQKYIIVLINCHTLKLFETRLAMHMVGQCFHVVSDKVSRSHNRSLNKTLCSHKAKFVDNLKLSLVTPILLWTPLKLMTNCIQYIQLHH